MIERDGDVFDTEARYIAHGVNIKGVMGAGIAKTVREKFPDTYKTYVRRCHEGWLSPGHILATGEEHITILNMATQDEPGRNARYDWVFSCLLKVAEGLSNKTGPKVVAMPEIGCGIGGLKWERVKELVEFVERVYPSVTFEVWHYGA